MGGLQGEEEGVEEVGVEDIVDGLVLVMGEEDAD